MTHPKAANDNNDNNYIRESRKPIACPTLSRLIKHKDIPGIKALIYWRDLTKPGDPYNPNAVPSSIYEDDDPDHVPQPEREMSKMFSPREIAYIEAAANDNNGQPSFDTHSQAHLGGLTFLRGKCTTPGVFNDDDEFGKVKHSSSSNGFGSIGEEAFSSSFEAELIRVSDEHLLRGLLKEGADVLDMACGDNTAERIGRKGDESTSTAEKNGKTAISEAICKLNELIANKMSLVA